jgi:8-oxo-dGTP pyrophosphatase MutT (NUDIX family)
MPVVRESREEAEARGVQVRRASVLLTLVPGLEPDGSWDWRAVLMERTPHGGVHGGQVSIPGGEAEAVDAGVPLATALREFAEEMGVPVAPSAVVGQLAPLYIAPSAFHVEAFVAVLPHEPTWQVEPSAGPEFSIGPTPTPCNLVRFRSVPGSGPNSPPTKSTAEPSGAPQPSG